MNDWLVHSWRSVVTTLISFVATLAVLNWVPFALIDLIGSRWVALIVISLAASFIWVVLNEVTVWIIDKILVPLVARSLQ